MDKKENFPTTWMLVVLTVTVVFVGALFLYSWYYFNQEKEVQTVYNQPEVILDFLHDITQEDAEYKEILSKYLVPTVASDDTRAEGLGAVRDALSFTYILKTGVDSISGFEVVQSREGYIEFALLDSAGERTYPLIVFAYTLTEDGNKIADYTLGRLQPFSRRHPEYGEEWAS